MYQIRRLENVAIVSILFKSYESASLLSSVLSSHLLLLAGRAPPLLLVLPRPSGRRVGLADRDVVGEGLVVAEQGTIGANLCEYYISTISSSKISKFATIIDIADSLEILY